MTGSELRAARRLFALRNHPDWYGQEFPDEATARMQVANALIDRALRQATARRV